MKKKENDITLTDKEIELTFSEARIRGQEERHQTLNSVFDKAIQIISDNLDSKTLTDAEKIFPAKTAIDTYMAKERFLREDARFELDKKRLEIEREKIQLEKAKLSAPGGPLYVIQKVENQTVQVKSDNSSEQLKQRKLAQAKALEEASGIPQFVEIKEKE